MLYRPLSCCSNEFLFLRVIMIQGENYKLSDLNTAQTRTALRSFVSPWENKCSFQKKCGCSVESGVTGRGAKYIIKFYLNPINWFEIAFVDLC